MTSKPTILERSKVCTMCKQEKGFDQFNKKSESKTGLQPRCRQCQKLMKADWQKKNSDWIKEYREKYQSENASVIAYKNRFNSIQYRKNVNADCLKRSKLAEQKKQSYAKHRILFPEKIAARKAVNKALKDKILVRPNICSECKEHGKIEAHHDSYLPEHHMKIRWLCKRCHSIHHRKYPEIFE